MKMSRMPQEIVMAIWNSIFTRWERIV